MKPKPKKHPTDATSLSLLARVRNRDSQAWQRLVDIYGPLIFAWCRRRGLNGEDAGDIVQEVFATVAAKLQTFRREKKGDTFRGWLRVITRNQINMHFRKTAEQAEARGGSTAYLQLQQLAENALDETEPGSEQSGIYQRILNLIRAEFEERTWKAFVEMTINGRKAVDVAADLQMSPGAVRQAKYAVLHRLRNEFEDFLN